MYITLHHHKVKKKNVTLKLPKMRAFCILELVDCLLFVCVSVILLVWVCTGRSKSWVLVWLGAGIVVHRRLALQGSVSRLVLSTFSEYSLKIFCCLQLEYFIEKGIWKVFFFLMASQGSVLERSVYPEFNTLNATELDP